MTTTHIRALLEQALEALSVSTTPLALDRQTVLGAIHAIRAELAKPDSNGGKTGWPPGMLQDDDRKLSKWLSQRGNARQLAAQAAHEAGQEGGAA